MVSELARSLDQIVGQADVTRPVKPQLPVRSRRIAPLAKIELPRIRLSTGSPAGAE